MGNIIDYINDIQHKQHTENMITIIAVNISRFPKSAIETRLNALYELCNELGEKSWSEWIKRHKSSIFFQPHILTYWPGPFKEIEFSTSTVGQSLYDKYKDIIKT